MKSTIILKSMFDFTPLEWKAISEIVPDFYSENLNEIIIKKNKLEGNVKLQDLLVDMNSSYAEYLSVQMGI